MSNLYEFKFNLNGVRYITLKEYPDIVRAFNDYKKELREKHGYGVRIISCKKYNPKALIYSAAN